MAEDVFGIVGSVIAGTYQVETVVAEGGFGVVYRAHHVGFRAAVALKCLKIPQQIGTEYQVEFLEQFRAEAELLFRLSASIPTVVRPLHVDAVTTADGTFVPFIALEWLEGETLDAIVARRKKEGQSPLSIKKLARLLTPVARALERAHNFSGPEGPISIVHRDLKPENIFVATVAGEQLVKILDFGIGKAKSVASQVAGRASQTQSRMASFTPAYGAPEQWVPKRYGQTGPWTDVWGLALTMVEVMAARPIIDGDQAGMMGTALDPARRPTPRNEGVEVDDAVEAVFARALAVDPRDRPADAGLFWNELLGALGMEVGTPLRRAALRDLRSDGGVVPRVETIEAAMRDRPSRISGTKAITPADAREAPTLDAVAAFGTESSSSGAAWPAIGMFRRSASGEMPAVGSIAVASAEAVPALELGPLPSASSHRVSTPAPPDLGVPAPVSARAPAHLEDTGLIDFDGAVGAPMDLALDLPHDEVPLRRSPSGSMAATRGTPPRSSRSSGGWAAVSSPRPSVADATGPAIAASPSRTPVPAVRTSMPPGPHVPLALPVVREKTALQRLWPGMALIAGSILVTLVDQAYAASTGEVFSFGPLRAGWVAGPLVLGGVVLVIVRLLPRDR